MDALRGKRVGVALGTGSETSWLAVISRLSLHAADDTIEMALRYRRRDST